MQWHKETTFMKSNRLSDAFSDQLSLIEMRVMQMAMADLWHSPTPIIDDGKVVVKLHPTQYLHHYNVMRGAGYDALQQSVGLEHKSFRFKDSEDITHKWVDSISYAANEGVLSITLSEAVLGEIPYDREAMPASDFTLFDLAQAAPLTSIFSMRLFEILKPWCKEGISPFYPIEDLKLMMGITDDKYPRMTDFKRIGVIEPLDIINNELEWDVRIEQTKRGRNIDAIQFLISGDTK